MIPHERCILCGEDARKGISIFHKFICGDCEKTLVNTDICDDMYNEYKELIKYRIILNDTSKCHW